MRDTNFTQENQNSKGKLSKKFAFGGIEKQAERLNEENIEVINYTVDLKKYQYKV